MLVVRNATVVTCDVNHRVIQKGALLVKAGVLEFVGPEAELPAHKGAQIMDARGDIVMPGLINMHAHCGDSLFRGLVEDLPLEPWLQTVWKAEAAILKSPENCALGTRLGIAELLAGGVTCVLDMFWHCETGFEMARQADIRWASGEIFFDKDGMDGYGPEDRPGRAREMFEQHGELVGVLPHGTYTVGPQNLKTARDIARRHGGFFCTHAAETQAEQAIVTQRYGKRIISHLDDLDILGGRTILAHCVHVDEHETGLLARSGTHVVHNPLSNLKLASGFAPVPAMLAAGINVTLGTDGPVSGNDLDMWLAMRLAGTVHKCTSGDATAVSTKQVLHMATLNGARALGAEKSLGSLEKGKRADFIVVETGSVHATPLFNPITHLIYSANRHDVRDVFVGGRQVVRDRQITTMNINTLTRKVKGLAPAIADSLKEEK